MDCRCFGMSDRLLPSLTSWNRADGWRKGYRYLAEGLFFFAEDAFGNQFGFDEGRVLRLQAETGDRFTLPIYSRSGWSLFWTTRKRSSRFGSFGLGRLWAIP